MTGADGASRPPAAAAEEAAGRWCQRSGSSWAGQAGSQARRPPRCCACCRRPCCWCARAWRAARPPAACRPCPAAARAQASARGRCHMVRHMLLAAACSGRWWHPQNGPHRLIQLLFPDYCSRRRLQGPLPAAQQPTTGPRLHGAHLQARRRAQAQLPLRCRVPWRHSLHKHCCYRRQVPAAARCAAASASAAAHAAPSQAACRGCCRLQARRLRARSPRPASSEQPAVQAPHLAWIS